MNKSIIDIKQKTNWLLINIKRLEILKLRQEYKIGIDKNKKGLTFIPYIQSNYNIMWQIFIGHLIYIQIERHMSNLLDKSPMSLLHGQLLSQVVNICYLWPTCKTCGQYMSHMANLLAKFSTY